MAIAAGLDDRKILTTPCPGGKERMRRLINVREGRGCNVTRRAG
jgi:hypothetical protein